MTDKPLTMKIQTAAGDEIEIPAVECEYCDGTGIAGQSATFRRRRVLDGNEEYEVSMKPGDRCLGCCGKGMLGVAGGPPRPIKPKPSEMN